MISIETTAVSESIVIGVYPEQVAGVAESTTMRDAATVTFPSFVSTAPSILGISGNDSIIFGGQKMRVFSSSGATTNGDGTLQISVVMSDGTPLTLKSSNTIISQYRIDATGVPHGTWVFSA